MSNLISDAKSVQSGQYEKFFGAKISAIGAKGAIGAKKSAQSVQKVQKVQSVKPP